MNIQELIKDLDPIAIIEFKNYLLENLEKLLNTKNSNSKIISNNKNELMFCEKCGCVLHKNRKTKNGIQKYICSGCKKTSSETTGTITYHSKLSFDVWKNIIDNLIDRFSIRRIAEENNISVLTSFKLRHKVLLALDNYVENIKLENSAQSDEKYFKINLIAIPSHFHNDGIHNIAEINSVHSQLETWLCKFREISTRHLQQYLNWFSYIFMMRKKFELKKLKLESYRNIIIDNNYIKSNNIFKLPMPIDLSIAYAEYIN